MSVMLLHVVKNKLPNHDNDLLNTIWKAKQEDTMGRIRQEAKEMQEKIRRKSTMLKKEIGDKTGKANQIREDVEQMKQDSADVRRE